MDILIAVIADLHLSDNKDTTQYFCFEWVLAELKKVQADLIILNGDITAVGNANVAKFAISMIKDLAIPLICSPGNAELRNPATSLQLADLFSMPRSFENNRYFVSAFDSSTCSIAENERKKLYDDISKVNGRELILSTHATLSSLDTESREWLEKFLNKSEASLFITAHRHFDKEFELNGLKCFEIRGLDPEKAIGAPPAIAFFKKENDTWTKNNIEYPEATVKNWSEDDRKGFLDNLGLSFLNADEMLSDMDFAITEKIPCIELRDSATNIDRKILLKKINLWRKNGGKMQSILT